MSRMLPGKTLRQRAATTPSPAATSMRQHTHVSPSSSLTACSTRLPRSATRARYERGLAFALARVDPAHEDGAVGRDREPLEGVRDRPVLVHAQGPLEAAAAVERARELQVGGEEHARRLRLERRPGDVDLAAPAPRRGRATGAATPPGGPPGLTRTGLGLAWPRARDVDVGPVAVLGHPGHQRLAVAAHGHRRGREVDLVPLARMGDLHARPRGEPGGGSAAAGPRASAAAVLQTSAKTKSERITTSTGVRRR